MICWGVLFIYIFISFGFNRKEFWISRIRVLDFNLDTMLLRWSLRVFTVVVGSD